MYKNIPISDVIVNTRIRKNLGNISELAANIQELALLSPILVTEDYELLAGERRLEACKLLGWTEIPAIVMSVSDAENKLSIEVSENEHRKSFTREELINAGIELERIESLKAEERMKNSGNQYTGRGVENFPQGKTRDIVAKKLGMSGKQYEREKYIISNKELLSPGEFDDWNNRISSTNKTYNIIRKQLEPETEVVVQQEIKEVVPDGYLSPEEYVQKRDEYIADLKQKGEFNSWYMEALQEDLKKSEDQLEEYKKKLEVANAQIVLFKEGTVADTEVVDNSYYEQEVTDIDRRINATNELYDFANSVSDLLENKLSPLKFKRCYDTAEVSGVARANIRNILDKVSDWLNEMYKSLDSNGNVIIDIKEA